MRKMQMAVLNKVQTFRLGGRKVSNELHTNEIGPGNTFSPHTMINTF